MKMLMYTLRVMNQMILGATYPAKVVSKQVSSNWRCYPVDLDLFGHMNNANYIRVAELSRWRMLAESGLFQFMRKRRLVFLLVEQQVTYARPIMPFQSYVVQTRIRVDIDDDKWLYYTHTFEEANPRAGAEPKQYAKIEAKTVMKEANGKTVRPSEVSAVNHYYRDLVTVHSEMSDSAGTGRKRQDPIRIR